MCFDPRKPESGPLLRAMAGGAPDEVSAVSLAGEVVAGEDLAALREEVARLKGALREAILDVHRVSRRCVDFDPAAGSTYEIDWLAGVKAWAALCDLDLEAWGIPPGFY